MKDITTKMYSPAYHFTKLQNKLYGEINEFLLAEGMNKTKLADKLGVTKGYISQLLNNGADHKLSKLIKLSLAIGKIPVIEFLEPEVYLKKEIQKRVDRQPLDLEKLNENLVDLHVEIQMVKEDNDHGFTEMALSYNEYDSYEVSH